MRRVPPTRRSWPAGWPVCRQRGRQERAARPFCRPRAPDHPGRGRLAGGQQSGTGCGSVPDPGGLRRSGPAPGHHAPAGQGHAWPRWRGGPILNSAISAVEIAVTARDTDLLRHTRPLDLPIDANSSERVTDRSQPDDSALDPLRSLESGDTDSLPFSLEGRVHTLDDGYLRFEQKGHLYRVPGRPGQFRAAVMRASELVRENKL